jgi:hypothetical protein
MHNCDHRLGKISLPFVYCFPSRSLSCRRTWLVVTPCCARIASTRATLASFQASVKGNLVDEILQILFVNLRCFRRWLLLPGSRFFKGNRTAGTAFILSTCRLTFLFRTIMATCILLQCFTRWRMLGSLLKSNREDNGATLSRFHLSGMRSCSVPNFFFLRSLWSGNSRRLHDGIVILR